MKTVVRTLGIGLLVVCLHTPARAGALKQWGLKAGYASSSQTWEHPVISDDDFSRKSGFHGGVFTEWLDHPVLSVLASVQYERKGSGYTSMETDAEGTPLGEVTRHSTLHYLSVPVLLKVATEWSPVSPYVLAGTRVDFLLDYDKKSLVWGIEDDFRKVSFGLSGGVGIEMSVSELGSMFVEFVYNYDLSRLYDDTIPANSFFGNETDEPFRIKNESFLVSVGIGL